MVDDIIKYWFETKLKKWWFLSNHHPNLSICYYVQCVCVYNKFKLAIKISTKIGRMVFFCCLFNNFHWFQLKIIIVALNWIFFILLFWIPFFSGSEIFKVRKRKFFVVWRFFLFFLILIFFPAEPTISKHFFEKHHLYHHCPSIICEIITEKKSVWCDN